MIIPERRFRFFRDHALDSNMEYSLMRRVAFLAWAVWLCGLPLLPAAAQTYPNRAVSIVVPYPAGGSVDGVARIIAQKLNESLGQHFVVDNRAGGAGGVV